MSEFNNFAREVDKVAKESFERYRKAEAAFVEAEKKHNEYPLRGGMVDAQYAAKSARVHAHYLDAVEDYKNAKHEFENSGNQFDNLRGELVAALNDTYSADPSALDGNTLELLKSGILSGSEYSRLLNKARTEGNATMCRLIGKYAGEAAASRSEKYGIHDKEAQALKVAELESHRCTGEDRLEAFDCMVDIYNKCTKNPALIDCWDGFLSETVKNF